MSIDVRSEDGKLLGDCLGHAHRTATFNGQRGTPVVRKSLHDQQHDRTDGSDLSKVSTFVNTGSPDASPPDTPHLHPRHHVDPRLSVSTSVRAWGQLDD